MQASCQCGQLTARIADGAEATTIMCHCIDCQRRSGSPFGAIAYFPREAVAISGRTTEYTRPADSGSEFTTGFCPTCGSTVYARPARIPSITGVTLGCLAGAEVPSPAVSVYEQSMHDWFEVPEGVSRHPRGRNS